MFSTMDTGDLLLRFDIQATITINIEQYESLFDQPPKEAIRSYPKSQKGESQQA